MYYYHNGRFLHDSLETPPNGAIPLTDEAHAALLDALSEGLVLSEDKKGRPVAVPPPPPPPPTVEEQQAIFVAAIQGHLDSFAQTRNYDGIMSAATYATSTIPKFAAEGQYAVEARDATWTKGYEILDAVLSGQRPMPTIDEVIAELPPLKWPEVSS